MHGGRGRAGGKEVTISPEIQGKLLFSSCCVCVSGSVWRSEDSCVELVLSTDLYVGSGDQTWVDRLVEPVLIYLANSLALKTSS